MSSGKKVYLMILALILCFCVILPGNVLAEQRISKTIAAGHDHSLVILDDETLASWGQNKSGQLGDGTATVPGKKLPVKVLNLKNIVAVSAENEQNLALKNDGSVWSWGANWYGQLGDGSKNHSSVAVKVKNLSNVIDISMANSHGIALKSDGTVWTWGSNFKGQLGNGEKGPDKGQVVPTQVKGLTQVISVAAGNNNSLVLKSDGSVWGWGSNWDGSNKENYFISGITEDLTVPTRIEGLSNVLAIDYGITHALALKSDGTIWSWGQNYVGALGDGSNKTRSIPALVAGIEDVKAVSAGAMYSLALKNDGTVWAWGYNNNGQLGDGTKTTRLTPVQVKGLSDVIAIVAGNDHSIAIKNDGTVWSWGSNWDGKIGDGGMGTADNRLSPIQVKNIKAEGQINVVSQEKSEPTQQVAQPSSWAFEEIEAAKTYGIVTERVLSDYQNPITREEFCELVIKLYESATGEETGAATVNTFKDTKNAEVLKAYKLGIVGGVGDGNFSPYALISREEIAVMLYRTKLELEITPHLSSKKATDYIDYNHISQWAVESVDYMSSRGIISGVGGNRFDPKGNASREQAIVLVKRVFEKYK